MLWTVNEVISDGKEDFNICHLSFYNPTWDHIYSIAILFVTDTLVLTQFHELTAQLTEKLYQLHHLRCEHSSIFVRLNEVRGRVTNTI